MGAHFTIDLIEERNIRWFDVTIFNLKIYRSVRAKFVTYWLFHIIYTVVDDDRWCKKIYSLI